MKKVISVVFLLGLSILAACGTSLDGDTNGGTSGANDINFGQEHYYILEKTDNSILVGGTFANETDHVRAVYLNYQDETTILDENGQEQIGEVLEVGQRVQYVLNTEHGCEESYPERCSAEYIRLAGPANLVEQSLLSEKEAIQIGLNELKNNPPQIEMEMESWFVGSVTFEENVWKIVYSNFFQQDIKVNIVIDAETQEILQTDVKPLQNSASGEELPIAPQPPVPTLTVDGADITVTTGTYTWTSGEESVVADSFIPPDLINETSAIQAGDDLTIEFDYRPDILEVGIWKDDQANLEKIDGNTFSLPEEEGNYTIVIHAVWEEGTIHTSPAESGDAIYAAGIQVKKK